MDIRQLSYLIQIAESGTFIAAAKQNFISQSALSKSIKSMENELGVTLFHRFDRHTELTPIGRIVYAHAKDLMEKYSEILDAVDMEKRDKQSVLRIGIPCGAGSTQVYKIVADFLEISEAEISVVGLPGREEIKEQLDCGNIDIGVSIGDSKLDFENYSVIAIGSVELCLLVSDTHPFAVRKEGVRFSELKDEFFVMPTDEFWTAKYIKSNCERLDFPLKYKMKLNRYDTIFDMVRQNYGVAVVATELWDVTVSERLVVVPLKECDTKFDIALVAAKETPTRALTRRFLDFAGTGNSKR